MNMCRLSETPSNVPHHQERGKSAPRMTDGRKGEGDSLWGIVYNLKGNEPAAERYAAQSSVVQIGSPFAG
jgi:hypothetical protein